jgi:hypothetical protein
MCAARATALREKLAAEAKERQRAEGVLVMPPRVGDRFDHGIDEPRNRHLATPS